MAAMEEDKFWGHIQEARAAIGTDPADPGQDFVDALYDVLMELSPEEVTAFQERMRILYWNAYTYLLAAAIYVIRGDRCDPDDFHGFRGWLIGQGRAFYEEVLRDPDVLADENLVAEEVYLPDVLDIAGYAYQELTGQRMRLDPQFVPPEEPAGEPLPIEKIAEKLPRLCDDFVFTFDEE